MQRFRQKKQKFIKYLFMLAILLAFTLYGFMLKEVNYSLNLSVMPTSKAPKADKSSPFKLALLTDLHSCYYGENQHELVDRLKRQRPNIILLGGDIYDDRLSFDNTDRLLAQLPAIAPTYYVDGNHEWWLVKDKRSETLQRLTNYGVIPIMGKQVTIPNTRIVLFGLSDPDSGQFDSQLEQLGKQAKPENLNILLSHRPERIDAYRRYPFDLVLSGHAHGGQWRLPFVFNGLFAPSQGFFPKYAGGRYEFVGTFAGQPKTTYFIVSRGLARESTKVPRFFNHPELVFIELSG